MTRRELVNKMSERSGYAKSTCNNIIAMLADEVCKCIINGDKLVISGFMSFEPSERRERDSRNPQTGDIEHFPAVKSVKCKMCKAIKEAINKG